VHDLRAARIDVHGLYIASHLEAWASAAELSAQSNIVTVPCAHRRVPAIAAPRYDDLWTAAKAMYKTEPMVADGGEVIVYAPHITEISSTHGALIDQIGYHVRDYFLKQWAASSTFRAAFWHTARTARAQERSTPRR
jgi:nickel-dependent lactate racemase